MAEINEITRTAFCQLAANILGHELSDGEVSRIREYVVVRGVRRNWADSRDWADGLIHSNDVSFPTCCMFDDVVDALDMVASRLRLIVNARRAGRIGSGFSSTCVYEIWHIVEDPIYHEVVTDYKGQGADVVGFRSADYGEVCEFLRAAGFVPCEWDGEWQRSGHKLRCGCIYLNVTEYVRIETCRPSFEPFNGLDDCEVEDVSFVSWSDCVEYVETALGEYADDYDIPAIVDDVFSWDESTDLYRLTATESAFWHSVSLHDYRTEDASRVPEPAATESEVIADVTIRGAFGTFCGTVSATPADLFALGEGVGKLGWSFSMFASGSRVEFPAHESYEDGSKKGSWHIIVKHGSETLFRQILKDSGFSNKFSSPDRAEDCLKDLGFSKVNDIGAWIDSDYDTIVVITEMEG